MFQAQIIESGVVANVIAVDPSAVVSADGKKITWTGGEYDAPAGATLMMQAGAGIGWTLSGDVLVAPVATLPAPTLAQLQDYAGDKAAALLANPRPYTSSVTIKSDATAATLANWLALMDWATRNPSASTQWVADDFTVTPITATEIGALGPLVGAYAQTVYGELATVLGEIASATITTTAQIDAFAWTA